MTLDLSAALATLTAPWSPLTVTTVNDDDVRVVRTLGEFARHSDPETDELFLVLSGSLTTRLDAGDVTLGPAELHVVPRGTAHQPFSQDGAEVLLLEPSVTVNTGDTPGELTADAVLFGPKHRSGSPLHGGGPRLSDGWPTVG